MIIDIINKSGKTREQIASEMGLTRQSLHRKLKRPKRLSVEEVEKLSVCVGRSARNLFVLIANN